MEAVTVAAQQRQELFDVRIGAFVHQLKQAFDGEGVHVEKYLCVQLGCTNFPCKVNIFFNSI